MKNFTTFLLGFLVCLNVSFACINDSNSRFFEMQPFPNEKQLITGSFHVHSQEFHKWRIKDRLEKLKKDPNNPALLDDLSVSYEKTGQTQVAIDTLQSVLHKYPNRYETLANLGTFYIHHQEYQKGLELLKKAIKINPQAHYGREIYQIKVVEYILSLNKKPPFAFPIQKDKNFADFLLNDIKKSEQKDELIRAIVGVSGMLKFGNSDSPILLEVLGDLYSYIGKNYTKENTNFTKISRDFYTAAFVRSKLANKDILVNFFTKIDELESFEYLGEYTDNLPIKEKIYYNLEKIEDNIHNAKVERNTKNNEEAKILSNSIAPEKDINEIFSNTPKEQPDLFLTKKNKINNLITFSNLQYKKGIIENVGYLTFPFLVITTLLFIAGLLNWTYFKNKKIYKDDNNVEKILKKIKSYLILWNITAIFITWFLVSLLFIAYTDMALFLILPVFLFSLICIFTIRNIKDSIGYLDDDNHPIIKPIYKSKKILYFCVYGTIIFTILTKIWASSIESDKIFLLKKIQENIAEEQYYN